MVKRRRQLLGVGDISLAQLFIERIVVVHGNSYLLRRVIQTRVSAFEAKNGGEERRAHATGRCEFCDLGLC